MTENQVTSKDGTSIAYDRVGDGPAVILVDGALGYRAFDPQVAVLAGLLADRFTVYSYDRRGRGDSGDTQPYSPEREIEDIDALIKEAGGTAYLYGISSGAALAFEAARRLPGVTKLALYEPCFIVDDSRPPVPADYVSHLNELTAAGRRGDAVEYFMTTAAGVPPEFVGPMRNTPFWETMEGVAHTIAYDGAIVAHTMAGRPLPASWASVTVPTVVIDGGDSEGWLHAGSDAMADLLPNARRRTLAGQSHNAAPEALAPVLAEHFTE